MADRKAVMPAPGRVVIKIGSGVITSRSRGLLPDRFAQIVTQVCTAIDSGWQVILVSSGAVATGAAVLELTQLHGIPERQAAAAAGQSRLVWQYEKLFQETGHKVAQVLLTQDDVANRKRYLNARNTFAALLRLGVIPIVNENDSVVVEEIQFGDNDTLSGKVAQVVDADLLIMLTDVDGLYTTDPRKDNTATLLPQVAAITEQICSMAGSAGSREGTGGMVTKLTTATHLADIGIPTLLINGTRDGMLTRALSGDEVGTWFCASERPELRRKHWLAHMARVDGSVHLDAGASRAITGGGNSLLPIGVTRVEGQFDVGASVACIDPDGQEIARGLVNYSTDDIRRICGAKTDRIESILGHKAYDEVIHVDNLALTRIDRAAG